MRVAMICYRYPPAIGGAETAAATLSRALARLGCSVTVITGHDFSESSVEDEAGVRVYRFPLHDGRFASLRYVAAVIRIARSVGRHEVIHCHMATSPAVAGLALGLLWGVPVIVKPSSGMGPGGGNLADVRQRRGGTVRVALLRHCTARFVAVSAGIEHHLVNDWHVPVERVARIPNGVEVDSSACELPSSWERSDGTRIVLYVGRISQVKGVDVLLDAWSRAGEPGRLFIVGDGPDRASLESMSPSSVTFFGSSADPRAWYSCADLFVLPSRREGLSNALLEAVESGLPVVATDVGETRTVLAGAGILVPAEDAASLAAALLCPTPTAVDRSPFRARYGSDAVAAAHLELYTAVTARRRFKRRKGGGETTGSGSGQPIAMIEP